MINNAVRDIEGKWVNSIQVTHENKQSENNHYNIIADQFVVKLFWDIFLLFILDCFINQENKYEGMLISP